MQTRFTETYTFCVAVEAYDLATLWVYGTQVLNSTWNQPHEECGSIALIAGTRYSIRLDWQEQAGAAKAVLMWSSASQPKQVIPASQLFPGSPTPTPTFSATKTNTPTATKTYTPTSTPGFNPPSGQVWKFYYYAGAQKVAMRVAGDPNSGANGVFYTLGDHLGSTSLITNASGVKIAESRYMPWGETRFTSGYQPSDYLYTGQRAESGIGLYYYNARWYDPYLSRFTQADTIVTGGIQGFDRYSYVSNNPIRNIDPSGHLCIDYDIFGHVQTLCTDSSREETRGREPNGPNQFRNPSYWNKWELPSPAKVSSITSESNNSIIKSQICSNYAPGTNPICYSQSMPDTTDLQITLFGYFYDYSETALNIRIPVISIPIDIVAQINRDKDQGYSDFQMAVRSILVAGEGQLASVVSSLSGGTTLILTGENVPIAIGTYIITSVSISSLFNTINEGSIFPLLHLTKQEDIKSYSN